MPKTLRGGFDTYWTTFGQGTRKALMIHCTLAHSGAWGGMARSLSGALDMVAFDMPGHGRSADWDDRGEIQGVVTKIAADFLEGPTDIIGHSFGATVALRLAVERPELVRSLVLFEPVFFAVAFADHPELRGGYETGFVRLTEMLAAGDSAGAAREFTADWGDGRPWESLSAAQQAALAGRMHFVQAGGEAIYHDAGGMLASGALERIEVPVLLMEGSASPGEISLINEGLARRLPHAQRAVIVGAGHMAPKSHADQVASEVLRFLSGV